MQQVKETGFTAKAIAYVRHLVNYVSISSLPLAETVVILVKLCYVLAENRFSEKSPDPETLVLTPAWCDLNRTGWGGCREEYIKTLKLGKVGSKLVF